MLLFIYCISGLLYVLSIYTDIYTVFVNCWYWRFSNYQLSAHFLYSI